MESEKLEKLINKCLAGFYKRRIESLDKLKLNDILRKKNPYLFKAVGIANPPEMINQLLSARLSSSDEGIFGEEFFEPICQTLGESNLAGKEGVDFIIVTEDAYEAISLKSGPNALNSDASKKQFQRFEEVEKSLRATLRNLRKVFIPTMGCGYGRVNSEPTDARKYYKLAGQAFWEKITGDSDFYLKLVNLMKDTPQSHAPIYRDALNRAITRFNKQFSEKFCDDTGNILWEEIVKFNSQKPKPKKKRILK
jgi:hypothetical protein